MKNICLVVEYVGTNYCGFQRQKNGLSVQQVLEDAICESLGEKCTVYPSGRTDAGVHAMNQIVNFFCNTTVPVEKIFVLLNQKLPIDVRVKKSFEVSSTFHARKSAIKKTYLYKISTSPVLSAFDADRALHFAKKLDLQKMRDACKLVCGEHNFSAFVASNSTARTTVRTVYDCSIKTDEDYLVFEITGNGFLYNMVRILVGTLLEVGRCRMTVRRFEKILDGGDRKDAGKTVLPCGLYLKNDEY